MSKVVGMCERHDGCFMSSLSSKLFHSDSVLNSILLADMIMRATAIVYLRESEGSHCIGSADVFLSAERAAGTALTVILPARGAPGYP